LKESEKMNAVIAPPETKLITGEELLEMGDIGPCELIDGRIVPMAPTGGEHGNIESNLTTELKVFVRQHQLGWVMSGEVGIYTRRTPDRVRGADVLFISKERASERPAGFLKTAPDLVVEVISPTDRWQDIQQKIEEYFAIGVQWVWVVEPENRAVRVYRSTTELQKLAEGDTLIGEGALAGFALPVVEIFAE
jgi:Uma2 family endonuclease